MKPKLAKSPKKPAPRILDKVHTQQEARALLLRLRLPSDPKSLLSRKTIDKSVNRELSKKEDAKLAEKVFLTLGFENDYTVALTVSGKYAGLAIELRRQLIKDLDCKTHTEKILVDAVVSSYIRTLRCTEAFGAGLDNNSNAWSETTAFLAMLSKELDRANRHLLAAYQSLIQLKQPAMTVQVKAKNAFISQAQQFNVNQPEPSYEPIVTP